ncbi:MAG TPA: hypothetical protein VMW30_06890 [Candidatus Paceibacterota bacterium]|nr:hypothetical protein [Candidatus Paceibacterota bacterium]
MTKSAQRVRPRKKSTTPERRTTKSVSKNTNQASQPNPILTLIGAGGRLFDDFDLQKDREEWG